MNIQDQKTGFAHSCSVLGTSIRSRSQIQAQAHLQARNAPAPLSRVASCSLFDFHHQFEQECVVGSAIAPALFAQTIQMVSDTEVGAGGEVSYPIHEALNWSVTRFGQQARDTFHAALLLNEDGSTWQAKLSSPRLDKQKSLKALRQLLNRPVQASELSQLLRQTPTAAVYQKYETTVGNGARAFLPDIPPEIRQRIGDRWAVQVPPTGSFWQWLAQHPAVPIVLTEGGKKALSLLSIGYVAIGLYGVNGGYRAKDELGLPMAPYLIEDVARFVAERQVTLAFDQDESDRTRRRVTAALHRFGSLLGRAGGAVRVARWAPDQGKGVDDLIVTAGAAHWETAYAEALPFAHWQLWGRLENQLTQAVSLRVDTAHLSKLDPAQLPQQGMIAIASAKGTEKTKLIAKTLVGIEKVIAGGHRIALMRNLCGRLGMDYRGDLDKVKGEFITGSAYCLRVGLVVDSLLSIDPDKFAGCDLILDEVVQVFRHLLTSATCAKNGMRPALLARLHQLIRVAKRVIVADADLDDATLRALKDLRNDGTPLFLIRNDFTPTGYPARFLIAPDRSAIVMELLEAARSLGFGKVLFVPTDSKSTSKAVARLLAQECPDKRVLLINSETSGGDSEAEFMHSPDVPLARGDYDIIICSPSVGTGISIEVCGIIERVFGIFTGASATDADIAQALARVREPVERIIWCAARGSNYSKVSRSTNPLELKAHLQQRTAATVSLIRSSLREDVAGPMHQYNWQSDPYMNLYCQLAAAGNYSMSHLRDALLVRLKFEGNQVRIENRESSPAMKLLLATTRAEQQEVDAEQLVVAQDWSYAQVAEAEGKEGLQLEENLAIAKFYLKEFYGLEQVTVADVLWDNSGRRRGELLNLEAQLFPELATDRTAKGLEKQASWNQGLCPWDISGAALRRQLRTALGLDVLIAKGASGGSWTKYDLAPCATLARSLSSQIKAVLHLSINPKMSDVQIVHQLLSQLGIKITFHWSQKLPEHEGEKLRVYHFERDRWQQLRSVLERRAQRWASQAQLSKQSNFQPEQRSPLSILIKNYWGDPNAVAFPALWGAHQLIAAMQLGQGVAVAVLSPWQYEFQAQVLSQIAKMSNLFLNQLSQLIPNLFS